MRSVYSSRTAWMVFGALALAATPLMAADPGEMKFSEAGYSLAEGNVVQGLDNDGGSGSREGSAGTFEFDERTYYANENAGVAVITVERSQGELGAVTVSYIADPGTANAGEDFDEISGTLSWANGDGSLRYFEVPLVASNHVEDSESVDLTLFSPTGGGVLNATRSTATLTILDGASPTNGLPGILRFDEPTFEVVEGQANALVHVDRSGGRSGAVTVRVSTADGSALAGADYLATSATLDWASGDSATKTFSVPIFDDIIEDGNESINLSLSSPTGGATLDPLADTSLVNLLDDDAPASICEAGDDQGCLLANRFAFEVTYRTSVGLAGRGHVVPLTSNSAAVWFFRPENLEMLIKVLDACTFEAQPAFWVFFASTTNVDFTVQVTDTHTGLSRDYHNLLGQQAQTVLDTSTFKTCGQ